MLILSTSYLYVGTYSSSFRGEREGGVRGREGGGGGQYRYCRTITGYSIF